MEVQWGLMSNWNFCSSTVRKKKYEPTVTIKRLFPQEYKFHPDVKYQRSMGWGIMGGATICCQSINWFDQIRSLLNAAIHSDWLRSAMGQLQHTAWFIMAHFSKVHVKARFAFITGWICGDPSGDILTAPFLAKWPSILYRVRSDCYAIEISFWLLDFTQECSVSCVGSLSRNRFCVSPHTF